MLVEGTCTKGHELVCTVRDGRLRGAVVKNMLRVSCPKCGGDVTVQLDDTVLTVALPSSRQEAG